MAASGEHGSVREMCAITVFVTVLAYWAAESYADVLGEQIAEERNSSWHRAWELLRQGFPLVEASFLPLFVLVVAWLVGVNTTAAITAGLVTNGLLLVAMGWILGAVGEFTAWSHRAVGDHGRVAHDDRTQKILH